MNWSRWGSWGYSSSYDSPPKKHRPPRCRPPIRPRPCPPPKPVPPPQPRPLKIKAQHLIADRCIQKVGTLTIEAPPGIGIDQQGQLTHNLCLKPIGAPVFRSTVIADKLINEGHLRVKLMIDETDTNLCSSQIRFQPKVVSVPFQSVHDIPHIRPGDHVEEFSTVEALLVSGSPIICPHEGEGNAVALTLKVVLQVEIIITRNCIICLAGEIDRCLPDPK